MSLVQLREPSFDVSDPRDDDEGEFTDDSVDVVDESMKFPYPGTPAKPNNHATRNASTQDTDVTDMTTINNNASPQDPDVDSSLRPLPKYVALSPAFVEPSLYHSELSKLLYWKCVKGDVDAVRSLLEQKAEVNYADRVAGTPLHGACRHNQIAVAQLLIEARAEVNAMPAVSKEEFSEQDNSMRFPLQTPLYYACRDNNQQLVDFLLMNGAAIDFIDKNDGLVDSPLNCAQQYGHLQLFLDLEKLIGSVAKPTIVEPPPQQKIVLEGQPLLLDIKAVAADYPLTCVSNFPLKWLASWFFC